MKRKKLNVREIGLLFFLLCLVLVYFFKGNLPENKAIKENKASVAKPKRKLVNSVLSCEPENMYTVFDQQFRLKPDRRVVGAFECVLKVFEQLYPKKKGMYEIGYVQSDGRTTRISLHKNQSSILEIQLELPFSFHDSFEALVTVIDTIAMHENLILPMKEVQRSSYWKGEYKSALNLFYEVDPRKIIQGLKIIEDLWNEQGPDLRLIKAAARGYGFLMLSIYPDSAGVSDGFASNALSYLAWAQSMAPASSAREEAFIAIMMGYKTHGVQQLKQLAPSSHPIDSLIDAYLLKDIQTLKKLRGKGSRVLSYYFLTRLYREMGLDREAEREAKNLLARIKNHYPSLVEMIHSCDFSLARRITAFYPIDIIIHLQTKAEIDRWQNKLMQIKTLAALIEKDYTAALISLSDFDRMLADWDSNMPEGPSGFFISDSIVKEIYRGLYSDALYFRYDIFLNSLALVDHAGDLVDRVSENGDDFPLAIMMKANVSQAMGKKQKAKNICEQWIISKPKQASAMIVDSIMYCSDDDQFRFKIAPWVFEILDGRPEHLEKSGKILRSICSYGRAEQFFRLALEKNHFNTKAIRFLINVTHDDRFLWDITDTTDVGIDVFETAGDLFFEEFHSGPVDRYVACYDKVLAILPSHWNVWRSKAAILQRSGRYNQAIETLSEWLNRFGTDDFITLTMRNDLAKVYLEAGQPEKVFEVLKNDLESYKGGIILVLAKAHDTLGRSDQAEALYLKGVKRFPETISMIAPYVGFLVKHDRFEDAVDVIHKGQPYADQGSNWYEKQVFEHLPDKPDESIIRFFKVLMERKVSLDDITSVAYNLGRKGHPDIAMDILKSLKPGRTMAFLYKEVLAYKTLKQWKGEAEAEKVIERYLNPSMDQRISYILYDKGLPQILVDHIKQMEAYEPQHREFMWIMRLIAWMACGKEPAGLESSFHEHFSEASSEVYHPIGKYLLGMITEADLLKNAKNPKKRCELSYYIGFKHRMDQDFSLAEDWYQICRSTGMANNGEYRWAHDELIRWANTGTLYRSPYVSEDIERLMR